MKVSNYYKENEMRTFIILMIASFFHGFVLSSFHAQDIIAKKALLVYDWQLTILVMLWPLSNLFSIWWGKILEHTTKLAKYFLLTGILGRLCLILMLWVTDYYQYLAILILVFSFNAFISPAQNSILQNNFSIKKRAKVFGYTSIPVTFSLIFSSLIAGKIFDQNENYFRYYFSFAGICGFVHTILMSRIKLQKPYQPEKAFLNWREIFFGPIQRAIHVLQHNKHFARFQRNYFIYGIAYMMLLPAIPIYLVEYVKMDYTQTFFAKSILSQLGIMFLAPFAGKIFDRKNPAQFTAIAYLLISLYPLTLFISSFFVGSNYAHPIIYLAFLLFSLAMSGILISWNISSICFAGNQDVSMYQSVHVTLTGLRGIFAPFLGLLIIKLLNLRVLFVLSFLLFLLASALNFRLFYQMDKKEWEISNLQIWRYFRKLFPYNS